MEQNKTLRALIFDRLPCYKIKENEPLAKYTSFRIGGPAELMVFPSNRDELQTAPDEGVRGLVVCLRDTFMGLTLLDDTHIEAMSGMTLAKTAMFAARNGLSGLEFAHGIPGTVGGAIYMNAGAYGGEIRDVAIETEFMRLDGTVERVSGQAQGFGYRTSAFQGREGVIVSAVFALKPGNEMEIREKIYELNRRRRDSQPLELPSAGSTFKRPKEGYAAALIDQAGLKGFTVGGAQVSEKHAGFVVNRGGATAADVLRLIDVVRERVLQASGIELEPEVRLWSEE